MLNKNVMVIGCEDLGIGLITEICDDDFPYFVEFSNGESGMYDKSQLILV